MDFQSLSVEDLQDLLERVTDDPDKRWKLEYNGLASDANPSNGQSIAKTKSRYLLAKDDQRNSRTLLRVSANKRCRISNLDILHACLRQNSSFDVMQLSHRLGPEFICMSSVHTYVHRRSRRFFYDTT